MSEEIKTELVRLEKPHEIKIFARYSKRFERSIMRDGICPKCAAKAIRLYRNTPAELAVGLSFFGVAGLVYYICTDCGYVELYVEDKEKLPRIAEKYPKV